MMSTPFYLGETMVAGRKKLRFECLECHSRFNLSPTRVGKTHSCKGCGKILLNHKGVE